MVVSETTPQPKVSEAALKRRIKKQQELARLRDVSVYEREDVGYASNRFIQATFPYTDTGETRYVARNGNLTITITSLGDYGLPYGTYPRLLMLWLTMAVMANAEKYEEDDPERLVINFGTNLTGFMRKLGLKSRVGTYVDKDGKKHISTSARLEEQIRRLFNVNINVQQLIESGDEHELNTTNTLASQRLTLRWFDNSESNPAKTVAADSHVVLSPQFFDLLKANPVPVDLGMLRQLQRSPLAIDVFCWLTYRSFTSRTPFVVPTKELMKQFGTRLDPENSADRRDFMRKFEKAIGKIHEVWPESGAVLKNGEQRVHVRGATKGVIVYPFLNPSVPRKNPNLASKNRRGKAL